jgi:heme/copper-type cytochrome/quinol oxidase subunit 2
MMIRRNLGRALIAAFLAFVVLLGSAVALGPSTEPRVIEVIADKDNLFKVPGQSKPVIVMKPGEKAIFRITSHFGGEKAADNAVHSFVVKSLRDQGWDVRLKEGTEDVQLVAPQQPGEYKIECTVKCGRGHDDMNMKLVVRN